MDSENDWEKEEIEKRELLNVVTKARQIVERNHAYMGMELTGGEARDLIWNWHTAELSKAVEEALDKVMGIVEKIDVVNGIDKREALAAIKKIKGV